MTPTPQPGATPNKDIIDRALSIALPAIHNEPLRAIVADKLRAFLSPYFDDIRAENAKLRAELESQRDQWRMSSVCRQKEAEIVRLRERLNGINRTGMEGYLDAVVLSDLNARDERDALRAQLAAVTKERDVALKQAKYGRPELHPGEPGSMRAL